MKMKLFNLLLLGTLPLSATAGSLQPFAEALFWNASEKSMANWATVIATPPGKTKVTADFPKFHTSPGVKAGFNFAPDAQSFDTTFTWTYFPTSTTGSIPRGSGIVTSDFFAGSYFITRDLYAGAFMDWQMVMNMFDLQAGHKFDVTPSLSLRPKLGVKGGSIYQTINLTWDAIFYQSEETVKNNFTGIGPSFGLDAQWNFYPNFSLVGNVSSAVMWGKWNNSDTFKRPYALLGLVTPTTISMTMNDAKLGTLMMDYFVGLNWAYHGKSQINLQLGYEMQYWANQLRLIAIQLVPTHGDLTIQGATCGLTIDL